MSCERSEELARLEWMSEAEVLASEQHARACADCARQRGLLFGATGLLKASQRELSPEGRVALRAAIDQQVERRKARIFWLPAVAAAAAVAAVIWWPKPSVQEVPSALQPAVELSAQTAVPAKANNLTLRRGSVIPVNSGTLTVEADAVITLDLEGGAELAMLESGALRVEVSGDQVFVVETPVVTLRASNAALSVVADRDAVGVKLARRTAVPKTSVASVELPRRASVRTARRAPRPEVVPAIPAPEPVQKVEETPEIVPVIEERRVEPVVAVAPVVQERDPVVPPTPRELMARADRLRRGRVFDEAAAIYREVATSGDVLANEASLLAASSLFADDRAPEALAQLRSTKRVAHLQPERAALEARILTALDRAPEAAVVLETETAATPELNNARLAVAKSLVESKPETARALIEPLLEKTSAPAIRVRALRIALVAAHAERDEQLEGALRLQLKALEEKNE